VPRIDVARFTVAPEAIDALAHANNREYLRWMEAAAVAHSAAQGWPMERYLALGAAWVVRSHYVQYLRPAFEADAIAVLTWVAGLERWTSRRRYLIQRERDRRTLARAETDWAFVDLATGRPREIPAELRDAFEVVADDDPELRAARAPR
jgi:acyl-CoA thioester hydrolase